jgi:heavy metal sensor kinase
MVAMAFTVAPEERDPASGWAPPPEEERRFVIQVALDRRALDRGLLDLVLFLLLAGAGTLGLAAAAGLLLARRVLGPIESMTREAAGLSAEETGRRLRPETVVRELHSLAETLNGALDRLAGALERQRRFASDASHELRTPVSVLLANSEHLLRRPREADAYRLGLERQLRTVRRMKGIVDNLLALARSDSLPEEIEKEPVPLGGVLAALCEEFRPLAEEKSVRLVVEADAEAAVAGNRRLLAQMAGNLLSNAVKFTPEGGTVTARVAVEGDDAVLSVADTGPGIPEEHRARVFERFFRVGDGRHPSEGAGLGLAICAWIARMHGGTIAAGGSAEGGAAIRVRLPLLRVPVPA